MDGQIILSIHIDSRNNARITLHSVRHRFTAGYIAELLNNGFQRPHSLLNSYITAFTQFTPTDAFDFTVAEGPDVIPISSRYTLDFHKLNKSSFLSPSFPSGHLPF